MDSTNLVTLVCDLTKASHRLWVISDMSYLDVVHNILQRAIYRLSYNLVGIRETNDSGHRYGATRSLS